MVSSAFLSLLKKYIIILIITLINLAFYKLLIILNDSEI